MVKFLFFILYIISPFSSFISSSFFLFFSSTQVSSVLSLSPPSFIFFFTSRTFQQPHHLLHIREKREREREEKYCCSFTDSTPVEIEVTKRTKRVKIGVLHVALPRTPPHCCSSSSTPLSWVRSACSFFFSLFFFHICLFLFNFIL